ncbi:unnamed protein product [Prunus armeniaca]|uniref:Uncharacterized protein n=1 Tax=Prunus armeniaca TaxID=36596 RepID=A0A6J5Y9G1_PRUAR|nr:unnamed protein product [Prunus armeniaca]
MGQTSLQLVSGMLRQLRFRNSIGVTALDEALQIVLLWWLDFAALKGGSKSFNVEKHKAALPRSLFYLQARKGFSKDQKAQKLALQYWLEARTESLFTRQSGMLVDTVKGSKWMFVLSTPRALCVGQKRKGAFHDSSFLSGGAAVTTGRVVAHNGVLRLYGHIVVTISQLKTISRNSLASCRSTSRPNPCRDDETASIQIPDKLCLEPEMNKSMESNGEAPIINDQSKCLSCKWATGVGPRIGWVREYPSELRLRALEQVRLSAGPQPKPTVRVSPRLSPKATSVEWAFLLTGLCLEILSLAFDQASSPSKPQYALFGMILAIAAVLICIWELIYKVHLLDCSIRLLPSPAIFLICLGAKRLNENRNEIRDEHGD